MTHDELNTIQTQRSGMTDEAKTAISAALYLIERTLKTVDDAIANAPNATEDDEDTIWTLQDADADLRMAKDKLTWLANGKRE